MKKRPMFGIKGLRKRWLINTLGVVSLLGLVCVLVVTAVLAANHYADMESDMRYRARTTTDFLADYTDKTRKEYSKFCITYVQTFEDQNDIALQFVDANGVIVASSDGKGVNSAPGTEDINKAITSSVIDTYRGNDPVSGTRIMAVSSPLIYGDAEVIGVLRYVSPTASVDMRVLRIACISLLVLLIVLAVVFLSSNYYIHSILLPLADIIDKARKITNGSYGIQIQTRYDDEIGDLADAINEMSNKISQNEQMQSEFISSLSHELRTPLTAITGWSETLLDSDDLDGDARRGMKIIHREAGRLTEMVLDLLDFTRMQDGRMTLNMSHADIRAEFEDTIYMYGSRLVQDGITLEYLDNDDDIPEILCDSKRLRQVFLNILDNAAKHGGDGKKIEAAIEVEKDSIVITIRDYGSGIPEDELPLVKKKFYKGSSKARGSGIGLAVCDEIIQLHGGTLTLENAPGSGTLVTIELPISQ